MKLGVMEAIDELKEILSVMPTGQVVTIKGQRKEAALNMAVEHLRRAAGYPPNLPGYVTIHKEKMPVLRPINLTVRVEQAPPEMRAYLSRPRLEKIAAIFGEKAVTYTARTCYEDSKPLLFGIPVIYGDDADLDGCVYLVMPEREK